MKKQATIGQSLLRKGGPKTASSLPDRKRKAGCKTGRKQKVALTPLTPLLLPPRKLLEAIDKRKQTVAYLNTSKAFDNISHGILLRKLKSFGLAHGQSLDI